jgi:hypothetical protein
MAIFIIALMLIPYIGVLGLKQRVVQSILNIQKYDRLTASTAESTCKHYHRVFDINQEINLERKLCHSYLSTPNTASLVAAKTLYLERIASLQTYYTSQVFLGLKHYAEKTPNLLFLEAQRLPKDLCGFPGPLTWAHSPIVRATSRVQLPDHTVNAGFLVDFNNSQSPTNCFWRFYNPKVN